MIAFTGELRDARSSKVWLHLQVAERHQSGGETDLTLYPTGLKWSEDGKSIYFESGVRRISLFKSSGKEDIEFRLARCARSAQRRLSQPHGTRVYMVNDFKHLDDLYASDYKRLEGAKLTNLNEALWKAGAVRRCRTLHLQECRSIGMSTVLWCKPIGWQEGKK
jgi:hypothetical protein